MSLANSTFGPLAETGYRYRPLKTGDRGWDIYGLQTALVRLGLLQSTIGGTGQLDGIFGENTRAAVVAFQRAHKLEADAIAGVLTQREVALQLVWPVQARLDTPRGLMRGQIEKESGFELGNYSEHHKTPTTDQGWDLGLCQRNSKVLANSGLGYAEGFDAALSVEVLATQLRDRYDRYVGQAERGVSDGRQVSERRAWELAAGSWNAPAWTNWLGGRPKAEWGPEPPTSAQISRVEAYIDRATIYLELG